MRLTNKMREAIVKRVIGEKGKLKLSLKFEQIKRMAEAEVKARTDFIERDDYSGYIKVSKNIQVVFKSSYIKSGWGSHHHMGFDVNTSYPLRTNGGYSNEVKAKGKLLILCKQHEKIDYDLKALERDLRNLVTSVSSTEELYMILPEAEKFIDHELVNRIKKNLK